jgi:hypothetical protein
MRGGCVINPTDIQVRLNDRSAGLADKVGRDLTPYTVALLAVFGYGENETLFLRGSGSLVSVGDTHYVLTAFHVWESFDGAVGLGLTLDKEDVDHRFFIDMKLIVPIGPKQLSNWNAPRGPDMVLLKIPPQYLDSLKSAKRFYPLTAHMPELPNVDSLDVWIVIGSPGEQSQKLPKHVSLTINSIFATVRSHDTVEGLDYMDLNMDTTFPGIPRNFSGVSGGGLWIVSIYGTRGGELQWTPNLVGMACWGQLPGSTTTNNIVRCLGAKSIRSLISYIE